MITITTCVNLQTFQDPYGVLKVTSVIEDVPKKKTTKSNIEKKSSQTRKVSRTKNHYKKPNDNNNANLSQKKRRNKSERPFFHLNTNVSNRMFKYGDPGYFAGLRNPVVQKVQRQKTFRSPTNLLRSRSEERRRMSGETIDPYFSPIEFKSRSKRKSFDLADYPDALQSFIPTFHFY